MDAVRVAWEVLAAVAQSEAAKIVLTAAAGAWFNARLAPRQRAGG